ncbi:hypothetical protein SCP_0606160 [Sparassis crispa]|uniref:Uncharacterized protein n=1 Tax=Sparassis crispa TaxID=139825 RepID=A0A401GQX9_9APHY|nr:hypothetical protein SCP_0606160 [Sparassis crispa]GBE84637.1 hypothetical protein SCP_0606160 [Sparassis crispa]
MNPPLQWNFAHLNLPAGGPAALPNIPLQPNPAPHIQALNPVAFFQQYQQFVHDFTVNTPGAVPPTLDQFRQYFEMIGHLPPPPPLPLGPAQIQPNLELAAAVEEVRNEIAVLKRDLENSAVVGDAAGHEADDEGTLPLRKRLKKTKKDEKQILSKPKDELREEQLAVREELMHLINRALRDLTGLKRNPFPLNKDNETDESSASDGDDDNGVPRMDINLTADIRHHLNEKVIDRAVDMVYTAQTNRNTCTLSNPDVKFTRNDLIVFAKNKFRSWRKAYLVQQDEEKKARALKQQAGNKRHRRQKQLKKLRAGVRDKYKKKHGVDPGAFLVTDWMSEQVSDWSDDDEEKAERRNELAQRANLTPDEIAGEFKVLERRQFTGHSQKLCTVYKELDQLVQITCNKMKNPPVEKYKRINLGWALNSAPTTRVYSCMLSRTWVRAHAEEAKEVEVFNDNPTDFEDNETAEESDGERLHQEPPAENNED